MKKFFLSIALALVASASLAQTADLSTNTATTRPPCLPQKWSALFSGINHTVFAVPRKGVVESWDCRVSETQVKRYAIVTTDQFQLNPICSTLGIDRLRVKEDSAVTSIFNMLNACGRQPVASSEEWDTYVRLLTIGHARPQYQESVARQWFGENFRNPAP